MEHGRVVIIAMLVNLQLVLVRTPWQVAWLQFEKNQ